MASALDYECWICGAPAGQPCYGPAAPEPGPHSERGATCHCGALLPAGASSCPRCESIDSFQDA